MSEKIKLQEEIIKADIKSVEKLWKNSLENNSLIILLEKMTKDELVKVAKKYSVRGITTLKKAEAVERVSNIILEKYYDMLLLSEENTIVFLKELMCNNGIKKYECDDIAHSNFLRNRGIAFTGTIEDELYVIIPPEIIELLNDNLYKELIEKTKANTEIIRVIAGIAYYYGVVTLEELNTNLERIFTDSIELEKINSLALIGEELGYDYVIDDNMIYHIDVEDASSVLKTRELNSNEYYRFDKKRLIKAGKPDYIETNKQRDKLHKVIGELFVIDENILKEEMDNFTVAIKNEMDRNEAIEIFLEAYEIESEGERKIFVEELELFANSIRRWTLKGYSQEELEKLEQRVVNIVKIGRNDPCYCGSSKKYKKCCAK